MLKPCNIATTRRVVVAETADASNLAPSISTGVDAAAAIPAMCVPRTLLDYATACPPVCPPVRV